VKRREFIALFGGAASLRPLPVRAQQQKVPTIGVLGAVSTKSPQVQRNLAAFRRGLAETGYVEGENVRIEYR
jgi:putative tryptophan/tyrosine transport system substrate-binding protein